MISVGQPLLGDEEREAVDRVMRSGQLAQGPEVAHFETEFSNALVEGRPCVAVNSGTAGLHLGLLACGVGPGDEVDRPVVHVRRDGERGRPDRRYAGVRRHRAGSFWLDAASVKEVLTERTVGVMPVHLYGHPADWTA